jgi:hypothetical protein
LVISKVGQLQQQMKEHESASSAATKTHDDELEALKEQLKTESERATRCQSFIVCDGMLRG